MSIVLDPHQIEAAEFVIKHKKAALFMGCGTGKTYTALEIYRRVKPKNCLIITTARLIREEQWHEEIIEYLGYMPDNIELVSHQTFSRRSDQYKKLTFEMIIFDEAHKVKAKAMNSKGTKITRLMRLLSHRAEYVVPMTGTPVGNDFIDVYNIFRNCAIDMWQGWTDKDFIKAYYYYREIDWSGAGFTVYQPIALKPHLKEVLWKLIRKKAIVVKTTDVLDLEKQRFKLLYVDDVNTTEMYKTIKKKMLKYKDYEDTLIPLRRINFERQAANGFVYEETYEKKPYWFNSNKIDKFEEKIPYFINKLNKIVIVYWFREDKAAIIERLDKLEITHTTSKKEFEKEAQVFILHFSDSEGLNLQKISYAMLFYSMESSYMNFAQITYRIYRRDQTEECYYIIMLSRGTIDEVIWDNIKHKKEKDDFIKNQLKK